MTSTRRRPASSSARRPGPAGRPEAKAEPGEISVLSLLGEMIDLEQLARLPAPRFTAAQAASTDLRSHRPGTLIRGSPTTTS